MKADVLAAVADRGEADAVEVADALGFTYEAAAMATLLRAYRGGLLARTGAPDLQAFRYFPYGQRCAAPRVPRRNPTARCTPHIYPQQQVRRTRHADEETLLRLVPLP